MSRKRVRLPLGELGQVAERGQVWVWRCFLNPCPADGWRRDPQYSRDAAEECLVGHLRSYHSAAGGDVRVRSRNADSPRQS